MQSWDDSTNIASAGEWDESVAEFFRKFHAAKEEKLSVEASPPRVNKAKAEYDQQMAEAKAEFQAWERNLKSKFAGDKKKGRDFLLRRAAREAPLV